MAWPICRRERESSLGSSVWHQAIRETSHRSVQPCRNCEFTTGRVIACIFTRSGKEIVVLLAGGNKRTQAKDIKLALRLAKNL